MRGAAAAALLLSACAPLTHEKLDAVLWMRTSAEWPAATRQAYALARLRLDEALRPENAAWSAALEQVGDPTGLPPAVIVDVDEAILHNTPFDVWLIESRRAFDPRTWKVWVRREAAVPIPGAVAFARYAVERGVRVFYVSNREYDLEESTQDNLEKHGFPVQPAGANILSKYEREGWGSDKTPRRAFVARNHRVLLIVGDDLNDFVAGSRAEPEARRTLQSRYAGFWGTRWIVLPNPVYGDWERSLYDFDASLSRSEILRRKRELLEAIPD